jgi:hypothetical protein
LQSCWSVLTILAGQAGDAQEAGRSLVILNHPLFPSPADNSKTIRGILAYELVRQALLSTAGRLGATVRDGSIGDSPPGGQPAATLELTISIPEDGSSRAQLQQLRDGKRTVVWTHGLPGSQRDRLDYAKLVEAVETITREDLPQQLTAAGVWGSPVAPGVFPLPGRRSAQGP